MDLLTVHLDGLMFCGDDRDATYTIERDGLRGWFSGVGSRSDARNREIGHGMFPAPTYLDGRVITLEGHIFADSTIGFQVAVSRLESALAAGGTGVMTVQAEHTTWADVARYGTPDVSVLVPGRVGRYQAQFLAFDPRRFGESRSFPGASVSVYHYGNFEATPDVTVVGPVTGPYTVTVDGKEFTVTQSLSSGQTHRIDVDAAWVYRDEVLQTGVVSKAERLRVPPSQQVSVSGPSSMMLTVPDTWV